MASNINSGSDQVERRVTRSGQVPTVRNPSENRRNRNSQVAAVAVADEGENETPAPRSRASRTVPRSQRDTRDAFTRIIAPALQLDRYKVELESAGQELMKEIKDLNFEEDYGVGGEVRNREKGIGNGKKILEASRQAVTWIESQIKSHNSMTEKRAEKMKKYQQFLSTLSVDVQIMLERLLVERQGHIIDLIRKNEELLKQFKNEENIETEAISNLRKQYEQSLYRNEEISKQKGRVDGELVQSREECQRLRLEKDVLFRENEELKNAALVSEQVIQQPREQLPAHQSPSHTPGINQPPRFEESNPTILQAQFGRFRTKPPPANVAPPSYKFLVSGGVEGGVTTMNVPPALNQMMMDQITEWLKSIKGTNWFQVTLVSRSRCVEVRVKNISQARAPSSSDDGDKFACKHCRDRHLLCVLVGDDGPVIAPLPLEQRAEGSTPRAPDYYISGHLHRSGSSPGLNSSVGIQPPSVQGQFGSFRLEKMVQ
ncbi:hypothetical protein BCON_0114g00280 [Botryotinia convoluta]|uniref:Uncharacterized protein n=1 Tax=Botryotinia convoluta TaxID=54673 RepID=A0A4Z1HY43_9HELO|nr:hypothetical protein BCON_0114g00280 [Botryotinia convoluta]